MRSLVTGGTGFLGRHLVRALARAGDEVHVLVRPSSDLRPLADADPVIHTVVEDTGSVTDAVEAARPDRVFHLAALYITEHEPEDVAPLVRSNVLLTARVLEGVRLAESRVAVLASTAWEHFEDRPYDPADLYAATKRAGEDIAEYYARAHDVRTVVLELPDTYGPDDPRQKLVPILVEKLRAGDTLEMSTPEQELDLLHVDDVVRGFVRAAEHAAGGAAEGVERFALRSGDPHTLEEIVDTVARAVGEEPDARWGVRPPRRRPVRTVPSVTPVLPGWSPRIGLEGGIRELLSR